MKFDQATAIWREIEVGLLKKEFFNKGPSFVKVLDLGCGEGEIAKEVFNKGPTFVKELWGVDNDRMMVEKARRSGVYQRVVLADAGKMPFDSNQFDLVFSNSVLEHILDLEQVLKEISRVLKKGGLLIATTPSHKLVEYIGWGSLYGWLFNRKYEHYHLYSAEKWKELLGKIGLGLVDNYYYLDKKTIKAWHKCLWLNKLGILNKGPTFVKEGLKMKIGGALAVKAVKL